MLKKSRQTKTRHGFTLVELMVAIFVLALGVAGALNFFVGSAAAVHYAEDLTTAYVHLEYVLEEMKTYEELSAITANDWNTWAAGKGLNDLPDEAFSVSYPGGTDADPLQIQVSVSWTRRGEIKTASLATQIAG